MDDKQRDSCEKAAKIIAEVFAERGQQVKIMIMDPEQARQIFAKIAESQNN